MDIKEFNSLLALGRIDEPGLFPHLDQLRESTYIFNIDFGLTTLPQEPGILLIRGPRQYGKSTWLEQEIYKTIQQFKGGSAYYLNGDQLADHHALEKEIVDLINAFSEAAPVKRLFIDEITAIAHWEFALKRLADQGKLRDILIITTGSKAMDLRRGAEKLPGRKGRLHRTTYLFTPVSYREFHRVCGDLLKEHTLLAYLLSGGSPIACTELAVKGVIPEFVIELTRDWIEGEIAASGRSRTALLNVMSVLFRWGGTAVGQAKLAREAGLSNNTIAAGYIEILNDLACVIPAYPWDSDRQIKILRKPCKYHFTNLLAAIAYHPDRIRRVDDFLALSQQQQGIWYEWLIAQELLRRHAMEGEEILEPFAFWQNQKHELDFVASPTEFLEVKRGASTPVEFGWFPRQFPHKTLRVINAVDFQAGPVQGVSLEQFLLND
jgi:uncharacterized protein